MSKNRSQGFTLIELLVVIAIIGILSAVVLASLNTARTKGADAAIQSDLSTVQTQAEIYYSQQTTPRYNTNGTSGLAVTTCTNTANTVLADATVWNAIQNAQKANGDTLANVTKCAVANDGSSYAVAVQSKVTSTNWYCTDSSGNSNKVETTTAMGGGAAKAVCE